MVRSALAVLCVALAGASAHADGGPASAQDTRPFLAGLFGAKYDIVLQAGFIQATPDGYAGRPPNAPKLGSASVFAHIDIETNHVDIGHGWDIAMAIEFGRQPLFAMVKTSDVAAAQPAYIDGLTTGGGLRFARASTSSETAIVARAGFARIGAGPTRVGRGNEAELAVVAANDIAQGAVSFDARVDLRWYDRDMGLVHLAAEPLTPIVHAYVGVRHDQRFHRAGDLSEFDDPTGRVFFGFAVHPIHVSDRRAPGGGNTLVTVGGGFEYEGALRGPQRLPSGFRLVLSADLDLVKAVSRGHGSDD